MVALAQEFHISVTPLEGQDRYLVRTERVAPGVSLAEEQVTWPVEDWLAQARQLMNDPLLNGLSGESLVSGYKLIEASQSSINLVSLGQQLYNALFYGSLRDSWMMAQAIAQNQRSVLRLRLGLKGTRLPRLPWEVLHAGDRPLATGTDIAFSRYYVNPNVSANNTFADRQNQSLKILMVIASPTDQENLALKQEAIHLQQELRHRVDRGFPTIQLKIIEQPGREQLTQALEQGEYQVFHYAGHSNLGAAGGNLYLVSSKTGLTETLSGDDLAGLLANNGVQMAVFNSCRGVYTATSDVGENGREQSLAQALVKRGIPSVLAMAEKIPDEVALTLTRLFYRNLSQGYPIDLSLNRARQGLISAYQSNQSYWALPVLYLQSEFDGLLTSDSYACALSEAKPLALGDRHPELANYFSLPYPDDGLLIAEDEETPCRAPGLDEFDFSNFRNQPNFPQSEEPADFDSGNWEGAVNDLDADYGDYEDDFAVVSDLFRQISNPDFTTAESVASASQVETTKEVKVARPNQLSQENSAQVTQIASNDSKDIRNQDASSFKLNHLSLIKDWRRSRRLPIFWGVLGVAGVAAIALLGLWSVQNSSSEIAKPPIPSPTVTQPNTPLDTPGLTTAAINAFSRGDLPAGEFAVEELLNRQALVEAKSALEAVPKQQIDRPTISFLRGRLVWQFIKIGNQDYSSDDARRYWETALKKSPNSNVYRNALGFAYYAEGKFDQAVNVWHDALYKPEQKSANAVASQDILNTYAGLSLGLYQLANTVPDDRKSKLLNESLRLRQKVMRDDRLGFQPDELNKNWMWPEKAIKDWRSLLQIQQ